MVAGKMANYTEDALVEQPAIKLVSELEWFCRNEAFETKCPPIQDQAQPYHCDIEEK